MNVWLMVLLCLTSMSSWTWWTLGWPAFFSQMPYSESNSSPATLDCCLLVSAVFHCCPSIEDGAGNKRLIESPLEESEKHWRTSATSGSRGESNPSCTRSPDQYINMNTKVQLIILNFWYYEGDCFYTLFCKLALEMKRISQTNRNGELFGARDNITYSSRAHELLMQLAGFLLKISSRPINPSPDLGRVIQIIISP